MGSFIEELTEYSLRPDIIFWNDMENKVIWAELTCPMEHNLEAAFVRKSLRYASLKKDLEEKGFKVFEVSARGICASTVSELLREIDFGRKKSAALKFECQRLLLALLPMVSK
jgi:hypothetical protein